PADFVPFARRASQLATPQIDEFAPLQCRHTWQTATTDMLVENGQCTISSAGPLARPLHWRPACELGSSEAAPKASEPQETTRTAAPHAVNYLRPIRAL